jgi:hypothetical protein
MIGTRAVTNAFMERIPKEEKQARNAEQRGVSCTFPDQAMKIRPAREKMLHLVHTREMQQEPSWTTSE